MRQGINQQTVEALDALYQRVIREELREGYRGYHVHNAAVYMPMDKHRIEHGLSMYMHDSPLKPNDLIFVKGEVLRGVDVEIVALNAVLAIKDLIDRAYTKPEEVEVIKFAYD